MVHLGLEDSQDLQADQIDRIDLEGGIPAEPTDLKGKDGPEAVHVSQGAEEDMEALEIEIYPSSLVEPLANRLIAEDLV